MGKTAFYDCLRGLTPACIALLCAGYAYSQVKPAKLVVSMDDVVAVAKRKRSNERGEVSVIQGVPGKPPVVRLGTHRRLDNVYSHQFAVKSRAAVGNSDVLHLVFTARAVGAEEVHGDALVQVTCNPPGSSDKWLLHKVRVGPDWQRIQVPFQATVDAGAGEVRLAFVLGFQKQAVELAELRLVNHGSTISVGELPRSKATYPGREPNAPWRKSAAERIGKHRKSDFSIVVEDAAGAPVGNAAIRVKMVRHAFRFGSTISVPMLVAQNEDGRRYREIVEKWFNHVSIENALKWKAWDGYRRRPEQREETLRALRWLKSKGIPVHGHVVVWPGWNHLPKGLQPLAGDPDTLGRRVNEHLVGMLRRTKGLAYEWDVVNEAFSNQDLTRILGDGSIAHWFRLAHKTDPDIRLFYNDYGILAAAGMTGTAHQRHYFHLAKSLLDAGVPLHGLGLQSHFDEAVTPPETVLKLLEQYASLGLPIQITEFDVATPDKQLQADYLRDFMTLAFSHPAVNGFVMWGFWEGRHWRPDAAIFDRQWNLNPNGREFERLVTQEWWTNVNGKTDAGGQFHGRGFHGDYEVVVTSGKAVVRHPLTIGKNRVNLTVQLPKP